MIWLTDGRTDGQTDERHTIIRPKFHFGRIKIILTLLLSLLCVILLYNKRAQRALGHSPEEKVKGHSGDIYRGPLMLSTKYW